MACPPNHKFRFKEINDESGVKSPVYAIWISPNKDKGELVIQDGSKYVQLNKEKSAKLFHFITDKKLSDE